MKFQIECILIGVELKGMFSLPSHCQEGPAPIRSHHRNSRTPIHLLHEASELVIPTQRPIAVPNHDVAVMHDLEGSGFVVQFELMELPSEPDFVLVDGVVLANGEVGVADGVELASSYCRVAVQVDGLDHVFRVRIPQLDGVVDVERTAQDETLIGMPGHRVHPVYVVRGLLAEEGHRSGFILAQIQDETLVVTHPTYDLGLEGRETDVQHALMHSLYAVGLDIVNVGSLGEIHVCKDALLVCCQDEPSVLEAAESSQSSLQLVVVEVADLGLGGVNEVDIPTFRGLIVSEDDVLVVLEELHADQLLIHLLALMRQRPHRSVQQVAALLLAGVQLVELGVDDVHMCEEASHALLRLLVQLILDVHYNHKGGGNIDPVARWEGVADEMMGLIRGSFPPPCSPRCPP